MEEKKLPNKNYIIRKLEYNDISQIIKICRDGFPFVIKWQSTKSFLERWWQAEIISITSETWVYESYKKILGFVILIKDSELSEKEKQLRKKNLIETITTFIFHPLLFFIVAIKKIKNKKFSNYYNNDECIEINRKSIWIEPIAVKSNNQKKGIGKALLDFCEIRSKELKFESIKLGVEKNNIAALKLYEKKGFINNKNTYTGYIYEKIIV